MRAARNSGREKSGPKLFTELGERIHEAVLVHRDVILYANSQFASFVGVDRVDLIDRRLADLVAPEYADLVAENLRRRLAGAHGAERFEVEMVGLQGQLSLLELTTAPIEFEGSPALLVTGVEVIPTRKLRALASGKIDEKEAAARAALVAPPLPPPPPAPPPVQVFAHAVAGRGHRHHRRRRAPGVPESRRRKVARREPRAGRGPAARGNRRADRPERPQAARRSGARKPWAAATAIRMR